MGRVRGNGHPYPISAVAFAGHALAKAPTQTPIGIVNANIESNLFLKAFDVAYVFAGSIVIKRKTTGQMIASTKPKTKPQTRFLRTVGLRNGIMIAPTTAMAITVIKGVR